MLSVNGQDTNPVYLSVLMYQGKMLWTNRKLIRGEKNSARKFSGRIKGRNHAQQQAGNRCLQEIGRIIGRPG
jgi:hypothetical protein